MAQSQPKVKTFRLSELNPAAYNPRVMSDSAREGLAKSLEKFGCVEPIIVNVRGGENVIVGGHQRYSILLEKHGPSHRCTCVAVDLSEPDEKLLNLSLNNPHIQGEFSNDLGEYIAALKGSLENECDCLDLRISDLQTSMGSMVLDDDFFEDGAVSGLLSSSDETSITFVFPTKQGKIVNAAIKSQGKDWLTKQIVSVCRKEGK